MNEKLHISIPRRKIDTFKNLERWQLLNIKSKNWKILKKKVEDINISSVDFKVWKKIHGYSLWIIFDYNPKLELIDVPYLNLYVQKATFDNTITFDWHSFDEVYRMVFVYHNWKEYIYEYGKPFCLTYLVDVEYISDWTLWDFNVDSEKFKTIDYQLDNDRKAIIWLN